MAENPPDGGTPLYRVTRVEDSTMLSPTGSGFQRSKKVYYVTADGTTSYVEVPFRDFTANTVHDLINQDLGNLLETISRTGPVMPPQGY